MPKKLPTENTKQTPAAVTEADDRRKKTTRRATERRTNGERRSETVAVTEDKRGGSDRRANGPDGERRKVERRINEYVLTPDVLEFINEVNSFKSRHQKPFPTWSEIYEIFIGLGYKKE